MSNKFNRWKKLKGDDIEKKIQFNKLFKIKKVIKITWTKIEGKTN
jgi:hypothetical protein